MTPVEALQAALAGEHAAVHLYGVLGGRYAAVSGARPPEAAAALLAAYSAHRSRRDQLQERIRDLGAEPVAAEIGYELPGRAVTAEQILRHASELEGSCAALYAQAVAYSTGDQRAWAIEALADAAVRGVGFGAGPEPYPGVAEL